MLMSQNDRIRDLERKLYQNEHALEARTAEYMKVKIRIDELRIKYEPGEFEEHLWKVVPFSEEFLFQGIIVLQLQFLSFSKKVMNYWDDMKH